MAVRESDGYKGEAKTIRLTANHTKLKADGQDLAFITVEMLDANGIVNPTADNLLTASVKGPASLIAFGNADIIVLQCQ